MESLIVKHHGIGLFWRALTLAVASCAISAQAIVAPANDLFSKRSVLSGTAPVVSTYNISATTEPGEPSIGKQATSRSLWWSWTAPATGWANFSTFGSDGPLATGVFVGDSLPDLSSIGYSNAVPWYAFYDYRGSDEMVRGDTVSVPVRAGETYQIVVAVPSLEGETSSSIGRVILGINQPPAILSEASVSGMVAQSITHRISATNSPTEYGAENLPPGLSLNRYTGIISGKPRVAGAFEAIVSAKNPGGTSRATVRFEISPGSIAPTVPEFTSGSAFVAGILGASLSSSFYANNTPTEFTVDALPPGLAMTSSSLGSSSASAFISGTPTATGTFRTKIRATNAAGSADVEITFRIRAAPPLPVFSSAATSYGTTGTAFSYSLSAENMSGGTYEIGSLPAGLMADGSSIRGTPTEAGVFEVPVKATNAGGVTAATLTLVFTAPAAPEPVTSAPVITSAGGALGLLDSRFSYRIQTNDPSAQLSATGLPAGLSLNPATGLISGMPTATGNFTALVQATNALGTTSTTLSFSIQALSAFVISSDAMAVGTRGQSFYYRFPSFYPPFQSLTVDTSALPPGLNFRAPSPSQPPYQTDTSLAGVPTTAGIYRVPVTAMSNGAKTRATLTIVIRDTAIEPPFLTSAASARGNVGQSFSYYSSAANNPTSYTAANLPPGLSISPSSGQISGTPTRAGTFTVDLTVANAAGSRQDKLTISIGPPPTGTFDADTAIAGVIGQSLSIWSGYWNPVSNLGPATFAAEGLPPGLTISADGTISGKPAQAGTFPARVTATNAGGPSSIIRTFVISAAPPPPVITSALMAEASVGDFFRYSAFTSDSSSPLSFGPLPPGIEATGSSLTGTPTEPGTYEVAVTATNAGGSGTALVTLKIGPPKPPAFSYVPASYRVLRGQVFDYWFSSSNAVTSRTIIGDLPPGVTFDAASFRLSGTPTQVGSYPLKISASGPGGTTTAPFTLLVDPPEVPVIGTSLVCYHASGNWTYISASNNPTAFSASGLPASLSFTPYGSYAYVNGTIASPGTYPVTITAGNVSGSSSAVVQFTTNSSLSYGFNAAMTTATVNETFSYSVYWGGDAFMANRIYSAANLPPGLAINPANGTITGKPTAAGSYSVAITATHSAFAGVSCTLRILVKAAPALPVISEGSVLSGAVGRSFSEYLSVSGGATAYALDVVPSGLALDAASGRLSGTPTVAGSYPVKFSASNAGGTRTVDMMIEIAAAQPAPLINSEAAFRGVVGDGFDDYLYASNQPTSFETTALPPGLSLAPLTGKISGTPTVSGHFVVGVKAANAGGTATARLTFDVRERPVPVITSDVEVLGAVGSSFSHTLTGTGSPTAFSASNLPPGLSLDPATGTISGQPAAAGDYLVPISAANASGSGTATLTIRIRPLASWLNSSAASVGFVGEKLSVSLYASQSGSTITAESLPAGFTCEGNVISGTPTMAGDFVIPARVLLNGVETRSSLTLHIATAPVAPPVIRNSLNVVAFAGTEFHSAITASNRPTHFTAENLPAGIVLDESTGILTGTPTIPGVTAIIVTATNEAGTSTATITWTTLAPPLPVVTTTATVYSVAGQPFSYPVSLNTNFPFSYPGYPFFGFGASSLPFSLTARGLPPGMFLNPITRQIEGTAVAPGDYDVALTAATALGEVTTTIRLRVGDVPAAASSLLQISSGVALNAFGAEGSPFDFSVIPIGLATEVTATELPPGLALKKTTGTSNGLRTLFAQLIGAPTKPGSYPVKFTFSHAEQTASTTVTIVIPGPCELPVATHALVVQGTVGRPFFSYIGDGKGYLLNNAATLFSVPELPPGLTFDARTFQITGTPTQTGRFVAPISLTNRGGTSTSILTIAISAGSPPAYAVLDQNGAPLPATAVGYTGESFTLAIRPLNAADELSATGLPEGLTLRKGTDGRWTLAGTPTGSGVASLLLTSTGASGSTTTPLTVDIRTLDQSIPAPSPDPVSTPRPTPAPTPAEEPAKPVLVISERDLLVTTRPTVAIRGKVLRFTPRTGLYVRRTDRAGTAQWQRVRVFPDGRFTLRVDRLSFGPTTILVRLVPPAGDTDTKKIRIFRYSS